MWCTGGFSFLKENSTVCLFVCLRVCSIWILVISNIGDKQVLGGVASLRAVEKGSLHPVGLRRDTDEL